MADTKILSATGSKNAPKTVGPSFLATKPSIKSVAPKNINKKKAIQYEIGYRNSKITHGIGKSKILTNVMLFAITTKLTHLSGQRSRVF